MLDQASLDHPHQGECLSQEYPATSTIFTTTFYHSTSSKAVFSIQQFKLV